MVHHDEIRIDFGALAFESLDRPRDIDLILGVQGELRITIGSREWFHEPMFTVVELAAAVSSWLTRGGDLLFDTMEAEESPFLWVRETKGGCVIGAAWQLFHVDRPLSCAAVREEFSRFAIEVVTSTERRLGLGLRHIVPIGRLTSRLSGPA